MNITVTQLPETKKFTDRHRQYVATYPDGYPVHVRRVWHCENCKVEVGGHFGNKVYGDVRAKRCNDCLAMVDANAQMCMLTTGMTPADYQTKFGVAWNE